MIFTTYQPLLWLLVLIGLGLALIFSLVDRPKALVWGSLGLRALAIILLVLALCRPFTQTPGKDLHVVFLLDVSESVELGAAEARLAEIEAGISQLAPDDSWSLFAVGSGVRPFADVAGLREVLVQWQEGIADDAFRSESRIAEALLSTRLAFPSGKSRRVVVFSDGQATGEALEKALATLAGEEVDVQFRAVEGLRETEASIVSIEPSSPFAFQGEKIRMNVEVASNKKMDAMLRILNQGVTVRSERVELEAKPDNTFVIDVEMTTPGPGVWAAELVPDEDFFPINNKLATTVNVKGKPRILVLHREPATMRPFSRALEEQDFQVDVRSERGLPDSMQEILAFDAVVLADIPATSLTTRQMGLLRNYVADFGGGLAMLGSENSFGLGGYYKTPVEEVLPLVSRFEKEKEKPSLAMVLVIDKSGSMLGDPIALARQAAKSAVDLLGDEDQIAVVGFDSSAKVISEMRYGRERDAVMDAIESLNADGGTDVFPAMQDARDMLDLAVAKIKHMIILSDGQTATADHLGLTRLMADSGITVSTVALGEADKELMSNIAEIGKGRYYETNDASTVPQIFTRETMQASKAAIKEDLFGSVQVGDHPILSGYQKADLPFSLGYVMTQPKPTAQVLLATETGDPLLAISRFGLGSGLCWTSDLTEKWGGEWLAWDDFGSFWAQALRGLIKQADTEGLVARIDRERSMEGTLPLEILRKDLDQSPVNGIDWDVSVLNEQGALTPLPVVQTGLGKYRVGVPTSGSDSLTIRVRDRDADKLTVVQYLPGYPEEYRLSSSVPQALSDLAAYQASEIREGITPNDQPRSIVHWFVFAAMACLIGGIVLRRI